MSASPLTGRLAGKVALVTGASRGIGAAIAERLAAEGACVAVNYTSSSDAAAFVVARIRASGGTAEPVQADVSRVDNATPLINEVVRRFGKLDVLVNNAAVAGGIDFDAITEVDFDRTFATNVKSVLFLTQAAAQIMLAGSAVINIGSIGTRIASPRTVVYTATKAAVSMLTLSMARALGPRGIRVVCVAPGMTETEMLLNTLPADVLRDAATRVTLGRLGQVDDIAPVVAFLASDDARWITTETIHVDGGQRP